MKSYKFYKIMILLLVNFYSYSFDWKYYINKYPDLKKHGINRWDKAMNHYLNQGLKEGRVGTPDKLEFTDFDQEYYKTENHLNLNSKAAALEHYQKIGFFQKLPYCQKFTIAILLHLYDLNQINNFIEQINSFMVLNNLNNYYIKINVPIDKNLNNFNAINYTNNNNPDILNLVRNMSPYHKNLVNQNNCNKLFAIYNYISENINIPRDRIQIIFSENRGLDIGGFFLALDQLIKQDIKHDFIIKLHTKSNTRWLKLLNSFLNCKINPVLRKHNGLYSNKILYNFNSPLDNDQKKVALLFKTLNLPPRNFDFCGGTIFIAPSAFTQFFKNINLINIFSSLNKYTQNNHPQDGKIENAYERLFGYIIDSVAPNKYILDYTKNRYGKDNKIYKKKINYSSSTIKQLVQKNNIKMMAIYFPQFHEVKENNQFWGNGFTEWDLINRYKGTIKKPHTDIGQYNILDNSTRKKQAIIAKEYGINSFCYYHYWFKDRAVMQKGLEKMLEDGEPNLPFVFCWANEPWTRNWDGKNKEVLLKQSYGDLNDWRKHYYYLSRFFKSNRYIKENNSPVIYIYNLDHIIKKKKLDMLLKWQQLAKQDGFNGLKIKSILGVSNTTKNLGQHISGFAEHQPNFGSQKNQQKIIGQHGSGPVYDLDIQNLYKRLHKENYKIGSNYSYGINYSFDQRCRRKNKPAARFVNLSYKAFDDFLVQTILKINNNPNIGDNYILINSWNEWGEQAMIEPNDYDGYAILDIIKKYFA